MAHRFFILLFLTLTALSNKAQDLSLKITELLPGMDRYSLLAPDDSCVCSLTTTQGSCLAVFDTPIFDTIDASEMPPGVPSLIAAVKAMKAKYDLHDVVVIGDVYVPVAHRGHGYARQLIEEACTNIFSQGFKTVTLIPDPFEYEDGKQKLLHDKDKEQKLVHLYQTCGFIKDSEDTFMYRTITG